jgi:hypothetical protein
LVLGERKDAPLEVYSSRRRWLKSLVTFDDVRFGSKADMCTAAAYVCWP